MHHIVLFLVTQGQPSVLAQDVLVVFKAFSNNCMYSMTRWRISSSSNFSSVRMFGTISLSLWIYSSMLWCREARVCLDGARVICKSAHGVRKFGCPLRAIFTIFVGFISELLREQMLWLWRANCECKWYFQREISNVKTLRCLLAQSWWMLAICLK